MSRISVRVTTRASREGVNLGPGGIVLVRVMAPPADGAANAAVTTVLARALGVPPREVVLVLGAGARDKVFEVPLAAEEVLRRLGG